jgi:hypothetical protein
MLVRLDGDGALAIGQLSHAWLSGQLARAWGNPQFGAVEPREAIALGAEQHDIGWALFDLLPRFNAESGLPRSFLELTVADHLAIWRGAPEHLCSQSLHAALVVSLHGCSLSQLRLTSAPAPAQAAQLQAHVDEERARQARLRERLGVSDAQADRTRRHMWTWDGLSLALCNGWRPFTAKDVPTADGLTDMELREREDGSITLDPWPFDDERVEVRCEARRLDSRYEDEAAMRDAFARAEPVALTFLLVAPRDAQAGG